MQVRFRWGSGYEQAVDVCEPLPDTYRLDYRVFNKPVFERYADESSVTAEIKYALFNLYRSTDDYPIYIEAGHEDKWLPR